jgi:glycosyltransferase involved in cell wall biosynthesis
MPSRLTSDRWADPEVDSPAEIDVLIPTAGRAAELAVTLAGLAAQDDPPFRVIISDQSDEAPGTEHPAVEAMIRVLRAQGRTVEVHRHLPRRGLAEQRQFLFECSSAPAVLYLDDDVWLEPGQLERMSHALDRLGCGFVGEAVQGLSYLDDERPEQQSRFELWNERVEPERVRRGSPAFQRWPLHNAANLAHIARRIPLSNEGWAAYKIAWVSASRQSARFPIPWPRCSHRATMRPTTRRPRPRCRASWSCTPAHPCRRGGGPPRVTGRPCTFCTRPASRLSSREDP